MQQLFSVLLASGFSVALKPKGGYDLYNYSSSVPQSSFVAVIFNWFSKLLVKEVFDRVEDLVRQL